MTTRGPPLKVKWQEDGASAMDKFGLDKQDIRTCLHDHLSMLTRTIGERSMRRPDNLERTVAYIQAHFDGLGMPVHLQSYRYRDFDVSNVVARLKFTPNPSKHYVLGAHYDAVAATVGADDNASAVSVLMETARAMQGLAGIEGRDLEITFVAFALEESPTYGTRYMGSRVFASEARNEAIKIDGMICLEMVGYTCREPGCQRYPFPLQFLGYPKTGDYIGIVGNVRSAGFTRALRRSFEDNPNLPVVTLTVPLNGWPMPNVRLSDHVSFWNHGYRAVMVTDTAFYRNPHYHLPSDTMQTLDFDFMAELVESLTGFFRSQGSKEQDDIDTGMS
jgi:hypothetical protein